LRLDPRRGEVWLVGLDPTRGGEIQKTRPVVVISSNAIRHLDLRLIVPIISRQPGHVRRAWMIPVDDTPDNGLTKPSSVDAFQVRAVSLARFIRNLGALTPTQLDDIADALALCVDYVP